MKKASEVFKSIRFAKGEPRDKPHMSTDDEEHYVVGEKEWNQQVAHAKKMAMQEEVEQLDELSPETLQSYKDKAKDSAEAATAKGDSAKSLKRWSGHMKATGKQIEKTTANIRKALNREDVEQIDELVKRDVSKDVQTMDKVSFIKKHGVSKSQAKVLAQEGENKQMKKDPCWKGYEMVGMKKKNGKEVPNCVPTNEGVYSEKDIEDRENAANPGMRSSRKSGVPFDGPYKKKPSAKPGKYGSGYSTAKHLAKQGLKKAMGESKEVKLSKKAQIVKNAAKEKFNKDPELSDSVTKNL